jgi:hypothetical protein
MSESRDPATDESSDPPPIERVRTEEPQAPVGQEQPNPNVVSDATADEKGPGEQLDPGIGGYEGRDPKTEMPRVPTAPETQDASEAHGGAPPSDGESPASNQ